MSTRPPTYKSPANSLQPSHRPPESKASDPIRISLLFPLAPPFLLPHFPPICLLPTFLPLPRRLTVLSLSLSLLHSAGYTLWHHFVFLSVSRTLFSCLHLFLSESCTLTRRPRCYSSSFSRPASYVLVFLLLPVERVKEQRRQPGR